MIALPLWIVNLYVWHIPALYDATVTNEFLHALQHACFITFGDPDVDADRGPAAGADVVRRRSPGGLRGRRAAGERRASGNILMWSGAVLYVAYAAGEAYWNISALRTRAPPA